MITTCISTTMVLVLLGVVVLMVTVGNNFSRQLREGLTVEVVLSDSIQHKQLLAVQSTLRQAPYSRHVAYISKEKGIANLNEAMGSDIGTFEGSSPIPAEFEVYMKAEYANLDSLQRYEKEMAKITGVTEVIYPKDEIQSLDRTIPPVGIALLAVAALLAMVSFSLINNTVRMNIYARRYSIHTMKLVGASWRFIRRPFMWQALRIGLVAAVLAGSLLGGTIYFLQFEAGAGDIYVNQLITPEVWIATLGCIFVCGIGLTALCALFSVNHHLRMRGGDVFVY